MFATAPRCAQDSARSAESTLLGKRSFLRSRSSQSGEATQEREGSGSGREEIIFSIGGNGFKKLILNISSLTPRDIPFSAESKRNTELPLRRNVKFK